MTTLEDRLADFGGTVRDAGLQDGWRPTGQQMFDAMAKAEQDAALGPTAAEKVRSGAASLADFVDESKLATQENFITQTPAKDVPN